MQAEETTIKRAFFCNRERYHYDFRECTPEKGWTQWDTNQDAPYFGVWVNKDKRQILTFAEGDETLETCSTPEVFKARLASMTEFYGPPPPAIVTISQDGQVTEFYDERVVG